MLETDVTFTSGLSADQVLLGLSAAERHMLGSCQPLMLEAIVGVAEAQKRLGILGCRGVKKQPDWPRNLQDFTDLKMGIVLGSRNGTVRHERRWFTGGNPGDPHEAISVS
jgi:hypothetical protein